VNLKSEGPSSEDDVPIYMVPAVDRAARILLMLSTSAQGMTLAEIASATGWHKSSIHKILVTLGYHGFLERDEATKRYVLGIGLVRFGQSVLRNLGIHHSAKAFLKELAEYSGETATLAIVPTARPSLHGFPRIGSMRSYKRKVFPRKPGTPLQW
jgi:hypothetical protein